MIVALITTLIFVSASHAAPSTTKTINFEGRLLTSAGAVVPDGNYNIQFKIYQDGAGNAAGNPGGSLKWTETYANNGGDTGVEVKNGFLSVSLGSKNPFGTSVDWNEDTLWLSMNIAGTATSCASFGSAPCAADGEMLPMKRITATPYAINAGAVNGKTADNFVQLGQGVQTDATTNTSSIFVNKTGTGNLVQLQGSSTDVLTIAKTGDITLGSNADKTISVQTADADIDGNSLSIQAGAGGTGTGSNGGTLALQGGAAGGLNGDGGNVTISGGAATGTGADGLVILGTPTFKTASQQDFAANGTITQANLDNNGAVILNATATALTVSMGDPTNTTAGRVVYVTVPAGSEAFTLSTNGGGVNNTVSMKASTTATMLWNGSDWTVAGVTASTNLQDIYNKSVDGNSNVRIGSESDGSTTLFTVDKGASAPVITDDALLGSMYYDTTLGQVQCYEASGWGSCAASPDTFVSLSPEYSNAVMHGSNTGTITSDFCSDDLNINNGTSAQPIVCGDKETYNYYNWTSSSLTDQTRSIYVTYQLPSTFKGFVAGATSLTGLTNSTDSTVSYEVYKNNSTNGLTACGTAVAVSTGTQTSWQKATATGSADPSTCSFAAGDSILFKVNLTAANDANAYASNLGFAFSNN